MKSIELKNKIQYILNNNELSEDVKVSLEELKDMITDNSSKEEALNIMVKWLSIFKDASYIISIFKDLF